MPVCLNYNTDLCLRVTVCIVYCDALFNNWFENYDFSCCM